MTNIEVARARLTDGWKAEIWTDRIVISNAHGGITIDFERRLYRFGWVISGPGHGAGKHGRGWRERLIDEAIAALRAAQDRRGVHS